MTQETARTLDGFFARFSHHAELLLLLDYDGTLARFRLDRFKAVPYAGVRKALARIQQHGATRLAIITGRPANEIWPLLSGDPPVLEPIEVWGLHGAERLHPDGRRELEQAPASALRNLAEVREFLRNDNLGGRFEDKANAAVMHWRGAPPRAARLIEQRARELFEPLAELQGLALLEFECGLELRAGRDKGAAVEALIAEMPHGTPVAFLGDDLTDEAAFRAVNRAADPHLSVLVRPKLRETDADLWMKPPAELHVFLKKWCKALE